MCICGECMYYKECITSNLIWSGMSACDQFDYDEEVENMLHSL